MKTFEELGICEDVLKAITEMGYENPMPVQEAVIPFLLSENNDVIALAQTGTGKTAAFGLPIIQKIDLSYNRPQALILAPTRELCLQIAGDLSDYSKYISNLKVLPVYGGSSIESQIRALKQGVHIVVATPGRLLDLMNRRTVSLQHVTSVVLDEADEMLNMGFTESINEILASVPDERNMLLFSATMPAEIARISKKYMKNPREIVVGGKNEGAKNVKHRYYLVHAKDKYAALKRIADYYPSIYGIVFCRTRRETQEIADMLIQDGYDADSLHGELSQAQRDSVMQKFRSRNLQLLIATDVAARGLDVDSLTHVINYGLPDEVETYTHRSGRTGRAGKTGISMAIIHIKEKGKIRQIEKMIGKEFEKGSVPNGQQICEKQLFNLVDKIEKVAVNEEEIATYLPSVMRKLEWLSNEDLIKRVVSLEFNRLLSYYQDAKELGIPDDKGRDRDKYEADKSRDKSTIIPESGYTRLFISLGKSDGFYPNTLIELMNENVPGRVPIGKIDLMVTHTFFEVPAKESARVLSALNHADFYGRRIVVEEASEKHLLLGGGEQRGGGGGGRSQRSAPPRRGRDFGGEKGSYNRSSRGGSSSRETRGGRSSYNKEEGFSRRNKK